MLNETYLKVLVVVLALVAAVSWSVLGYESASAGDTFIEGHCGLGPVCVSGYIGMHMDKQDSFRVENYRGDSSWWLPEYEAALQKAEIAWTTAVGPQVPSNVEVGPEPSWVDLT